MKQRRKILSGLLAAAMVLNMAPTMAATAKESDAGDSGRNVAHRIYVSAEGNDDTGSGTKESPFASIERAKEAVRELSKSDGDIVVEIGDGFYSLDETLTFTPEDSGNENCTIYYEAAEGANPVISGGDKVEGEWTLSDQEKGIWKIPLNRDSKLRSLYVNGERSYMASTDGTVPARGSWGTYTVGGNKDDDDYKWNEIFYDDFSDREAGNRIGQDDETYELYAKSGDLENSVVNVVEAEPGNNALQIAHTANEDAGFIVKSDTYENALIELDYQFAPDHQFANQYESLQIQGWHKDFDNWFSYVIENDNSYMQSDVNGSVSNKIGTFSSSFEKGKWYSIKFMVLDGKSYVKTWPKDGEEPEEWTIQQNMPVFGEGGRLRIYAYKGGAGSNMDILIDNIKISAYDEEANSGSDADLPDWAWAEGTKFDGLLYSQSDLPEITRNIEDVEIENQQTWNKNIVCVREIEADGNGNWIYKMQQPYGAIAQTPGWGVGLQGTGNHKIYNAYELLDEPGEFYFDKTEKYLYYIPRENEDLSSAEVVVPRVETLVEFVGEPEVSGDMSKAGRKEITGQTEYITMKGLIFAHSDWGLQKVGDSYGKSTVQAGTVYTAFSTDNWHYDMYRNLDTLPGAVEMEYAHHIKILDGQIMLTGAEGVNMKNDVEDCEVSGNYFYATGGSGVVVGNPQHIYENDSLEPDVYVHHVDQNPENPILGATADKEKYQNGLEAVPRNDVISNNLFYQCGLLFPSHTTINSFFTENLQIQNNVMKDTSYSGMSVGWGWCNFDGKPDGFNDWGSANNQGGSVLPGYPTETSRENKILNNRIDDTMQILHDGGSIYTLGKQDETQIEGNYLRNTEHALYTDEGSAYFAPIKNNVSSGSMSDAIFAVEYGRKHDLLFTDNYSTNNTVQIAGKESINIKNENFHYVPDGIWELTPYKIALNSGLEKEYVVKYGDKLSSMYGGAQNIVLPASVKIVGGQSLPVMGFLSESEKIWIAPSGTQEFEEGEMMMSSPGNADEIQVPVTGGEYKIYVQNEDGTISEESEYTVYVEDGSLSLSQTDITLYLKGASEKQLEIRNLPEGAIVEWSSENPEVASVDENGIVTAKSEGETVITAKVSDQILECNVTVKDQVTISEENLTMWFSADEGVELAEDGVSVKSWTSRTGEELVLSAKENMPQIIKDENGNEAVNFTGASDYLKMDGVDFNDKSDLTVIAVSNYTGPDRDPEENGDRSPVFFVTEAGGWGSVYLSPFRDWIGMRFGTGVTNCHIKYMREEPVSTNSLTAMVKNGSTETLYVNGENVFSKDGQSEKTANNGSELYIGAGISNNELFGYEGTISEILVYDRALTDEEIADINLYFKEKYTNAPEKVLDSISIEGPTKTEYEIGEELDLSGLKVTAHYSDGSSEEIAVEECEISGFDSETAGEKVVTVSYSGKTAEFTVVVNESKDPVQPGDGDDGDDTQKPSDGGNGNNTQKPSDENDGNNTQKPGSGDKDTSPQTGDTLSAASIIGLSGLCVLCLGLIAFAVIRKRKR